MGAGFTRRFTSYPSQDVLTAIEGINIIDLPVPGSPTGVSENTIGLVGEFADMTYGIAVDAAGNISTSPNPVQIFGGQDLLNKLGMFDPTLGDFGRSQGNGFVELRNKTFGALVVCPVNLASSAGVRLWRKLPSNASATNATPVVPVLGATVPAGYLFKDAAQALERIKLAQAVTFTSLVAYLAGVDGATTTAASAATQTITSAAGGFTTVQRPDGLTGVQIGDVIVLGSLAGTGVILTNADTYRVTAVTSDTELTVEKQDRTNFVLTTGTVQPWRLHPASVADSNPNGGAMGNQATYITAVRPLTNDAGTGSGGTDGTWATGTKITPLIAPAALTSVSADPLSGLNGTVGPTTAVAYTAAVQAANAASSASIDALYTAALAAFLNDDVPENGCSHVWASRKSATIRNQLRQHALTQSAQGVGRTVAISPELNQAPATVITTVTGSADPGVGANRDERVDYSWPPVMTYVPEAVGYPIVCADGTTTTDGMLDTTGDGWLSAILGNLPPERNPGESSATTQQVLSPVVGYARGVPSGLNLNVWELLKSSGICGIRMDRTVGPVFQSGVTSSLTSGQTTINRRKMADYIEDSLAQTLAPFSKQLLTKQMMDSATGECVDFLSGLLSADNASAQRINNFIVDDKSGNTAEAIGAGIFVIIAKVQTIASGDYIVIQCSVGPNVVTTTTVSS